MDAEGMKLINLKETEFKPMLLEVETTFWKDELVCAHLDLTPEYLDPIFFPVINRCYDFDFSMAWVNEKGEPVSIVTNMAYREYPTLKVPEKSPEKTDALTEILGAIESAYQPEDPEKAVLSFTWSTRGDYARKGLFCSMMEKAMDKMRSQGYTMVMADCMNIKSQKAAEKMGFIRKAQVFYKPYVLKNGTTPFKELPQNQSIVRMVKYL